MQLLALPTAPDDVRQLIRSGSLVQPTSGIAPGYVQANLAILPRDLAFDFLLFCQRNPKPCPLLEVVEAGDVEPTQFAPGADLRTDVPLYRIYEYGEMTAEVEDISEFWRDDLVSFLLGCSFSFESALTRAGIPLRHIERETNVSMFITDIPATSAGVVQWPHRRLHEADKAGTGSEGRPGHLPVPGGPRRAAACWRPDSHRHRRHHATRFWRPDRDQVWRGPRVLGVRE